MEKKESKEKLRINLFEVNTAKRTYEPEKQSYLREIVYWNERKTDRQTVGKKEERNREYNQNDKASDSYYVRQLTIINVTNRSNYHEIIVNVIEVDVCDQTTKKTSQKLYSVTKLFYKPFFHFCKVSLFLP